MKDPKHLYMFAIMPPPALSTEIHKVRQNFAQEYNFVKALKPPVHITLYPPFTVPASSEAVFEQEISHLQEWANHQVPFEIALHNFGYFDNSQSPVLYIKVMKNEEILKLHDAFIKQLKKYIATGEHATQYKPHITIGYRDVEPDIFPSIRAAYDKKTFTGSFKCNAFYLWKHDGKNWQTVKEYKLNGNEQLRLPLV